MFGIDLGRIFAWAAAINAVIVVLITQLTSLLVDFPGLAKFISVLVMISAFISPFLPRAQGRPEGK